jgi:cytidine diphosphoramidate kinase
MKIFLSKQQINIVIYANLTNFKYRIWCRKEINNYFEIYLEANKNTLLKRNYKNLYKNALKGKIKNVVGIDLPFKKSKRAI